MTLRDLTPRQLYNLRRRCEKERKQHYKKIRLDPKEFNPAIWNAAFSAGLKAGLEQAYL